MARTCSSLCVKYQKLQCTDAADMRRSATPCYTTMDEVNGLLANLLKAMLVL
jgi:hypothetical protein